MHLFMQEIWKYIWELIREKNHTNAASVTLHLLCKEIWGHILKSTWGWDCITAANVNLNLPRKAVWRDIWNLILGKNHTNVANATMHLLMHVIWGHICKFTLEKKIHKCDQCDYTSVWAGDLSRREKSYKFKQCDLPLLGEMLLGRMWKFNQERNHFNATNATMHLLR